MDRRTFVGLTTATAVSPLLPHIAFGQTVPKAKNVVLVHGLFADGSSWSEVIPQLQAAGLNVTSVQNPLTTLPEAVDAALRVLERQNGPTVLAGHSFSGMIVTEAGVHSNVSALVYVAARAPDAGEDYAALAKQFSTPPAAAGIVFDGDEGRLSEEAFLRDFAGDLPKTKARALFAVQWPFHRALLTGKTTHAAWRSKPSWYAVSTEDRTINPDLQRFKAFSAAVGKRMKRLPSKLMSVVKSFVCISSDFVDRPCFSRPQERSTNSHEPTRTTTLYHKQRSFMRKLTRIVFVAVSIISLIVTINVTAQAQTQIKDRFTNANGVRLHYLVAGKGDPVILLHGYAQNSHMWRPLIAKLANTHTVIAPDLRGFGQSSKPLAGYDKKTMAQDVHALATSLGIRRVVIVGHDIGLMVAYAYAAQYPNEVDRIALMDAFLPGVGDWTTVWLLRDLWHFHFYGETPLRLVTGRERIYFEHFWNDFAADPKHSVPEVDRRFYARSYAQPGAMRAGFEVFRNFEQDAKDFAQFSKTRLTMPMLVLTGEKASGEFLIEQARLVDTNVEGIVIKGSGHWLMEEARDQVIPQLIKFITGST